MCIHESTETLKYSACANTQQPFKQVLAISF